MQLARPLFSLVLVAAVLTRTTIVFAAPADDAYAAATREYSDRHWQAAAEQFAAFADAHPEHNRADVARFYAGEALVQLGKHDQATRHLADFLEAAPEHRLAKTALFRLGESLLMAGKNEEAETKLAEFRKNYPTDELNAFALAYLGEIALEAGRSDVAFTHYEQALREFPSGALSTQCQFGLARSRQLRGQLIEALADYEKVAEKIDDPLADDARLQSALIQYQRREFADAEASLVAFRTTFDTSELKPQALYWLGMSQLSGKRPAEAARTLQEAAGAAADQDRPAVHVAWGNALRLAGDAAAADEQYKTVLSRWAESDQAADALHGRLQLAEAAGDQPKIESLSAEFLRRFPQNQLTVSMRLARVRGQLTRGEYAQAEPFLVELALQFKDAPGGEIDGMTSEQIGYLLALSQVGQRKYAEALATAETIRPTDTRLAASLREVQVAALLGLKKYDAVLPLLREALQAASGTQDATKVRSQLIVALAGLGKIDEAADELVRLDSPGHADPAVARVTLQVAERAYRANNLPLARRLFESLTGGQVAADIRGQALSGLAWTQFRAEGKQASAATFERLLKDYPDSPLAAEAAVLRGKALEELGQVDAALATYKLVIDRYAAAPQLPDALFAAARLHDRLEQDREAAALLTKLTTEFPQFAEMDAALYELGWVHLDLKQQDPADAAFLRLSREFPKSKLWSDATYRLVERAARGKDYDQAATLADSLLKTELDPELGERTLYLRGQIAASSGDWNGVAKYMQQFVEKYGTSQVRISAEYWLAEADFRRGHSPEARAKLEILERKSVGRSEAWLAMVPLRRAQCLAQEKMWAEALAVAQPIAERYPHFKQQYEVEYLIGRCLGSLGKLTDARIAYQRALDTPTSAKTETAAMAQWMIGETWFHQKRYAEAVAAYERAVTQHAYPKWQAASLLQAGKCQWLLGQLDQASESFRRVTTEYADTPYAAEASQRLLSLSEPATANRPASALRTEY